MFNRIFFGLIEMIHWLMVWLSPTLLLSAIGFVVYLYYPEMYIFSFALAGIGGIGGIVLAEYIRRTYGCTDFISKLLSTPETEEDEE